MMPADPSNVERAVSRTLRDSLERMQRTAKELDQAVSDFVAACASNRPANALPSMLRAQTASASLAATLEVLSRFVTSSLQPADRVFAGQSEEIETPVASVAAVEAPAQIEPPSVPPNDVAPEDVAPEDVAPEAAAPAVVAESVIAVEPAFVPPSVALDEPEAIEWPTAPESNEWSEAHESHDAPVQAEPFEADVPQEARQEVRQELRQEVPQDVEQAAQQVEAPEPHSQEIPSLTIEPPPDPALEPIVESALSQDISAMPDAVEPIATWSAPEQREEPVAPDDRAYELSDDGIVDERELTAEAAEATAIEESRIIEEAIAGGIAKMSELHVPEPVEVAQAVAFSDTPTFDIALLPEDERELHRRASRVAKVSMQDIKLLQPQQVVIGRENKDLCIRLHEEIERAHKEYGRRFKPIMSHPVDYFYDWMVEILGAGDPSALGEYPYQTPALRR